METLVNTHLPGGAADWRGAFRGRRVLVTGHTGFKGAWLSLWLEALGARVTGYALPPPTSPSLFDLADVGAGLTHIEADVRDGARLAAVLRETAPDFVFHLAAQALVPASYQAPLETLTTNVVGTACLLEALRASGKPCVAVIVTSDKVYHNHEWLHGYRECDRLGGRDPYSMSKAVTELVTASWRASFFPESSGIRVATARAGNVIGGGDWAANRIVPDCVAALAAGRPVAVRNPRAVRPWQHVLEPLGGYLTLAARLAQPDGAAFAEAWNFGPAATSNRTVRELVERAIAVWGHGSWNDASDPRAPHEATLLALNCDLALHRLGWQGRWDFREAVTRTLRWYAAWHAGKVAPRDLCLADIRAYEAPQT